MKSAIATLQSIPAPAQDHTEIWLFQSTTAWPDILGEQADWLRAAWNDKRNLHFWNSGGKLHLLVMLENGKEAAGLEKIRKAGAEAALLLQKTKAGKGFIHSQGLEADLLFAFSEGALLASYRFEKYKSKVSSGSFDELFLESGSLSETLVQQLNHSVTSVALARDLVNEPASWLTAPRLSEIFKECGEHSGFEVEVLEENRIQSLKMGGLLGVNQGSEIPPTFNILEYKGPSPKNKRPIVLVGKGVVYDTGGHSLKTAGGMETMKCDMAGAATVLATISAAARLKLPLHLIGLVPATDNRISAAALSPGDVITISDGSTVEVLNTDAEGRLILADALVFAKRYDPELVLDFATLTGAAARAIGKEGFVYMGTASEEVKNQIRKSQEAVWERGVEFPLWDEYAEHLKSPIADLKNIGGPEAGAITAGKFLQHFTAYPWIHFDIAGTAFNEGSASSYIPKGGTGNPVRMLLQWLKDYQPA